MRLPARGNCATHFRLGLGTRIRGAAVKMQVLMVGTVMAAGLALASSASAATLLEAAGGGGGAGYCCGNPGGAGQTGTSGGAGGGAFGGAGGTGGSGGAGATNPEGFNGGGGAGWSGAGTDGVGSVPRGDEEGQGDGAASVFTYGLGGGTGGQYANGGFGGGGGGGWQGGGGGGGYSGGGGGDGVTAPGGGGGSYIAPSLTPISATAGFNGVPLGSGAASANGLVLIDGSYIFTYTGAVQTLTIPYTGYWGVETIGAQGGSGDSAGDIGGYGALTDGLAYFTKGTKLDIIVGGAGLTGDFDGLWGGGGGGGSFVYLAGVPEPASWVMMMFGLGAIGAGLRLSRTRKMLPA
jgi:PEP-CTERM motif/Glycine rich protein